MEFITIPVFFLFLLILVFFLLVSYAIYRYKETKKNLEFQKDNLEALFKNSTDAIAFHDEKHNIININDKFTELFGYSLEDVKGQNLIDLMISEKPGNSEKKLQEIPPCFKDNKHTREFFCCDREKNPLVVSFKEVPVLVEGEKTGGYSILTDITERKRYEEQLMHLTLYDGLTGVYNREYFKEEINRLSGGRDYPVSIIMVDLDDLKFVNDSLGHEAGNRLLKDCAELLNKSVRKNDVVARIGGDEFALILPRTDKKAAEGVIERIMENLKDYKGSEDMPLRLSLGLATSTSSEESLMEVIKEADDNMYIHKDSRRSSIREDIINSLVSALSLKDFVEGGHTDRLKEMAAALGMKIGLDREQLKNLDLLCSLHDIGKAGISESIIFKPEKLDDKEWKEIKRHSEIGYRIAKSFPDFNNVADLILYHHERWDGTGYPQGLAEEEIPLECRIFSIVDAFDVMTSGRPYGKIKSDEEALQELIRWAGYQFDPLLVEIFVEMVKERVLEKEIKGDQKVFENSKEEEVFPEGKERSRYLKDFLM